jgi:hypothetical protein
MALEQAWALGEIDSKLCLTEQLKGIRVSKDELFQYLRGVQIEPFFLKAG